MQRIYAHKLRIIVLLALIAASVVSSLLAMLLGDQTWDALALNLGTELVGAAVIYIMFELIIERRENLEEKKTDLISQMGSSVRDVAVAAAEELRRYGWLTDGSLNRANLEEADLSGADLNEADLSGAYLDGANLSRAHLFGADLSGADLNCADLNGAWLSNADLSGAILVELGLARAYLGGANLSRAHLFGADLSGADLFRADLSDADLSRAWLSEANLREATVTKEQLASARTLEGATLPDGSKYEQQRLDEAVIERGRSFSKASATPLGCAVIGLGLSGAVWQLARWWRRNG